MLLLKLFDTAKRYFLGPLTTDQPNPVEVTPEVVPTYNLPEVWSFPGARPSQSAVHTLNKGLVASGEHIEYLDPYTGKVRNAVSLDDQQWPVKAMVYWLAELELDTTRTVSSVGSSCGNRACARPDHLVPRYELPKDSRTNTATLRNAVAATKTSGPPEVKLRRGSTYATQNEDLLSGDRSKCVSAKVYFESNTKVQQAVIMFNTSLRKPGGRRLYGYECDWCDGHHLTKQNPKTRPKYVHKGSWS